MDKNNWIAIDLDDTLVLSQHINNKSYIEAISNLKLKQPLNFEAVLNDRIKFGAKKCLTELGYKDKEIKMIMKKKIEIYKEKRNEVKLNMKVINFLTKDAQQNNIAIISNAKRENIDFFLNKWKINYIFKIIVSRDDTDGILKPDYKMLEVFNKKSNNGKIILYIGDNEMDKEFAEKTIKTRYLYVDDIEVL